MDNGNHKYGSNLQRHLSPLKLVSRLLGHEMHAQGGAKAITLSREQVIEVQTAIDLFIEEASRRVGGAGGGSSASYSSSMSNSGTDQALAASTLETQLVPARN